MKEKIKDVFKRVFESDEISDTISQQNCDKWDSLRHLNLVVELEETFGVSFEPEEIVTMKSLNAIEKKISEMI
jgi:acyl carrier protein